ncbi:MAG TPA: hypothetical protein VFA70_04835 [Dehalococcoidia bacterium]|nr:hypothetical protein [Dehalococcoidia bacterium]
MSLQAHGPRAGGVNIGGRAFSNGDLAVGIGLIIGIISAFLPWYSVSVSGPGGLSVSDGAFVYWAGWLFFIAALVGLIFWIMRSFVAQVSMPQLPATDAVLYLVVGILMIVLALIWWLAAGGTSTSINGAGVSAGVSWGLWLGLIAGIVTAVGGFLKRQDPQPATRPFGTHAGPGFGGVGGPGGTPPPPPPPAGV